MIDDDVRRTVHMLASVLLDYPEGLDERLEAARAAIAALPAAIAGPFQGFVGEAARMGERALCEHYVATFDQRRRATLYLSFYTAGDTRQRGAAILAFNEALTAAGMESVRRETSDFLPLVLELSALTDGEVAMRMFAAHREGVETIRAALEQSGSLYVNVLDGLLETLPPLDPDARSRVRELIAYGPPAELVGVGALPFPAFPKEARQ